MRGSIHVRCVMVFSQFQNIKKKDDYMTTPNIHIKNPKPTKIKQFANPEPKEWLAKDLSKGLYADWKFPSVSDGNGVIGSLFVSGCMFHCHNCFNASIWNFNNGKPFTKDVQDKIIQDLSHSYVQGLTLLGGEPFLNTNILIPLIDRVRKELPTKDIWSWSGYTWEELLKDSDDKLEMLSKLDVLVDGRFDERLKAGDHPFRGSSNQRIIDVPASLKQHKLIKLME